MHEAGLVDQREPSCSTRCRTGAISRGSLRSHVDRPPAVFAREPARGRPPVRGGTRMHSIFLHRTNADTHTKIKIHIPIYKALPRTCLVLIEHREEAQQRARSRDRAAPIRDGLRLPCGLLQVGHKRSSTRGQGRRSVPSKVASKYQLQV
jgi:hypothetical protein